MQLRCPACGYDNLASELGPGGRGSVVTCQQCGHRFSTNDINDEEDRTQAFEADETSAGDDRLSGGVPSEDLTGRLRPSARPSLSQGGGRQREAYLRELERRKAQDANVLTPAPSRSSLSFTSQPSKSGFNSRGLDAHDEDAQSRQDRWSPKDLIRIFVLIFEPWRVFFATGVIWAALIIFAVMGWVGQVLGDQVPALRSLFFLIAWGTLFASFLFVSSTLSFQACRGFIEGRAASIGDGVDWFKTWSHSLVGAPLVVFGIASIGVIIESLVGLLGRVPTIGPYLWSLGSPLVALLSIAIGLLVVFSFLTFMLLGPITYFERRSPIALLRRLIEFLRRKPFGTVALAIGGILLIALFISVTVLPAWLISTEVTTRVALGAFGPQLLSVVTGAPESFGWMVSGLVGVTPTAMGPMTVASSGGGAASVLGMASGVVPAFVLAIVLILQNGVGAVSYCILSGRTRR